MVCQAVKIFRNIDLSTLSTELHTVWADYINASTELPTLSTGKL